MAEDLRAGRAKPWLRGRRWGKRSEGLRRSEEDGVGAPSGRAKPWLRGRPIEVLLQGGDDASGMASMIAGLVEENVRDFSSRALAARLARGSLVLEASDRQMAVSVSFHPGRVTVTDGQIPRAPVVAGEWLDMAKLCSGQASMVGAVLHRQARIRMGKGLATLPAAAFALTVPRSFYEEHEKAGGADIAERGHGRRAVISAGAGVSVLGVALFIAWRRCRRT